MESWSGESEHRSILSNINHLNESVSEHRSGWVFDRGDSGLYLSSSPSSLARRTFWEDGRQGGTILGAITNLDELGLSYEDIFENLLDGETDIAAAIEGDFLITCYDSVENKFVIVTDKLGARPCYYTTQGGFSFANSVSALLSQHSNPTVDQQAVSDMLLMGHLWGDRTLVSGIKTVRPATVLEAIDGTVSSHRYWQPDYDEITPGEAYLDELTYRYRQAVKRTARTLPEETGLWLSGGLDSRTTAAALREATDELSNFKSLQTYTYDANPPTNDNPRIARQVAKRLDLEHITVPLTADTFGPMFDRVIDVTDGMVSWHILNNLSATYSVKQPPEVMLEGMVGELLGDHPFRYHLSSSSAVRAQYQSEAGASPETVKELLRPDVDPFGTYRAEVERTSESTHRATVLDIHFQNYYARSVFLSDQITRDRVESRVVEVDGDYLELCARLPRHYRKGTFPFTERFVSADAGGVPYGTSRAKLELCRRIAPSVSDITYERTKVQPKYPYPLHAAGFVANVGINRLRGKATYGSGQLADFWIRDATTSVHRRVTSLVDDACDRPLFNADRVRSIYERHMNGENNASMLAKITTIEHWLQANLD